VVDIAGVFELSCDQSPVIDAVCGGALVEIMPEPRSRGIEGTYVSVGSAQEAVGHDVRVRIVTRDCSCRVVS
jgi:hypothetical protein